MNHPMKLKLAMCNFLEDVTQLRAFAFDHGFSGVDWSFDLNTLTYLLTHSTASKITGASNRISFSSH